MYTELAVLCVFAVLCVHYCFFTLDAGLLARSQYSEGPATGHYYYVIDSSHILFSSFYTNERTVRCYTLCSSQTR